MAIIKLTQDINYDTELSFSEQSDQCIEYCNNLNNYNEFSGIIDDIENYPNHLIKRSYIIKGIYKVVNELKWNRVSNKYEGSTIYVLFNEDYWHYESKTKRAFLNDFTIGEQIGKDSSFAQLVNYVLDPDPSIDPDPYDDLEKEYFSDSSNNSSGWFIYFNIILPEHEAILNNNNISIQNKPSEE